MNYRDGLNKTKEQLEIRFNREFNAFDEYEPRLEVNGFEYPNWPIIIESTPDVITIGYWGLIPSWGAADISAFRKKTNTLNAMIETLTEKPTYKNFVNQRCLIPVDRFYEWKHVGKEKIKHQIVSSNDEIFCIAGIYSVVNNLPYYNTILTTEANTLMAEIHNTKKRMPVVLHRDEENNWLSDERIENYFDRSEIELIATPITEIGQTGSLF